jgi:hypothetical protein
MAVAHVNRNSASQVRQPKIHSPVTAKRRAQQTKERLVLVDGQQLPVAKRPALGRKAETEDSDFREKWFCHDRYSLRVSSSRGVNG